MMKLKNFLIGIFGFILLSGLTSCNTDVEPYGEAGAYNISMFEYIAGTDTYEPVYQLALWAFGNKAIASVDATVGGKSYKLTPTANSTNSYDLYKYEIIPSPLEKDLPCTFIFNFSSGETYTINTTLAQHLTSPNITSFVHDSPTSSYTATWGQMASVGYLEVVMYDDDLEPKAPIFASGLLSGSTTTYTISASNGGWASGYPANNRNLILEVQAHNIDQFYQPSALSISKPWYFTWGTDID